jgi:hypothetical protein
MILLCSLNCTTLYSQALQALDAQNNLNTLGELNNANGLVRTFNQANRGIKGSPFLNEFWAPGVIILFNGDTIPNGGLNYDAFYDEVKYLHRLDGAPLYLSQGNISSFIMVPDDERGLQYFRRDTVNHGNKEYTGFFQVISENELMLILRKTKTIFFERQYAGAYKSRTNDEYSKLDTYFLIRDGETILLPQKPGKLAKKLGMKKRLLFDYTYENQLDLSKEKDFRMVIAFYMDHQNKNDRQN